LGKKIKKIKKLKKFGGIDLPIFKINCHIKTPNKLVFLRGGPDEMFASLPKANKKITGFLRSARSRPGLLRSHKPSVCPP